MTRGRPRTHATIEAHDFNHAAFQITHAWADRGANRTWSELMRWFNAKLNRDDVDAHRVVEDATQQIGRTPK